MSAVLGDDKEKSTAQAASDDLRGAINMGRSAAHTAKTVSKAAAQAVSGDVAGAAVSILKDPETMKNLLIIILLPVILFAAVMVIFLYALPTAIFETVVSFFDGVKEKWETIQLSNEYGGGFFSNLIGVTMKVSENLFDSLGNTIKGIFTGIWNSIKSVFGTDEEGNQTEEISENAAELTITAQEASEKLAIVKKAIAVNKKYDIRAKQIEEALEKDNGSGTSIKNSSGKSLNSYIKDKFCGEDETWAGLTISANVVSMGTTSDDVTDELTSILDDMQDANSLSELEESNEEFNDTLKLKFPAVEASGTSNTNAISTLSLLMVQQGGSLLDMKMSDFMKYLGWYKNSNPNNISFDVGYCSNPFYATVKSWKGTFKPQYLVEEMKNYQQRANMLKTQLMGLDASSDEAKDIKEEIDKLEESIALYENSGMPLIDLLIKLDFIDLDNLPTPTTSTSYKGDGGTCYTYSSPDGNSKMYVHHYKIIHNKGTLLEYTEYLCSVTIACFIVPAGMDNVAYQVGLWNGSLDTAQGGALVDDAVDVGAD